MAKRNQSLVALSHDHHHGLALALRLKQGDKALLTDGWTHDRREQAARVSTFYDGELCHHFYAEEQALFPAMLQHIPESTSLIATLLTEHRMMERLVGSLGTAQDAQLESLLVELGSVLERHIRSEERELFVLYQSAVSEALDAQIGRDVAAAHDASVSRGSKH